MKQRTKRFSLDVIKLVEMLPSSRTGNMIANQLLRCGTSVGANYRAACRARSVADFIAKMGIVEEEADECIYWFEIVMECGLMRNQVVESLSNEADELLAIVVSSINTAKRRK